MYTGEILESMKKVEAARDANLALEPRRMTAEEKDALLSAFHPDYKESEFEPLKMGVNRGDKVPHELASLLQGKPRIGEGTRISRRSTMRPTCSSSAAAARARLRPSRRTTAARAA